MSLAYAQNVKWDKKKLVNIVFWIFWRTSVLFVGPLIPLFWTSSEVPSDVSPYSYLADFLLVLVHFLQIVQENNYMWIHFFKLCCAQKRLESFSHCRKLSRLNFKWEGRKCAQLAYFLLRPINGLGQLDFLK